MTERAQPGAQGSTMRNIEIGEATGSITDGFIVPSSDPTFSAQRWDNLNEGQFDEFDASYSSSSLTVTIQPGEAFVKGWLATDESHDVALESFEDGQEIRLGWDADSVYSDDIHTTREEADSVLIRHEQNWPDNMPYIPIWEFDTDGDGVTSAIDRRLIGPHVGSKERPVDSVYAESATIGGTPVDIIGEEVVVGTEDDVDDTVSPRELNLSVSGYNIYTLTISTTNPQTDIRLQFDGISTQEYYYDTYDSSVSDDTKFMLISSVSGGATGGHPATWTGYIMFKNSEDTEKRCNIFGQGTSRRNGDALQKGTFDDTSLNPQDLTLNLFGNFATSGGRTRVVVGGVKGWEA